jgi:hypothetical protein
MIILSNKEGQDKSNEKYELIHEFEKSIESIESIEFEVSEESKESKESIESEESEEFEESKESEESIEPDESEVKFPNEAYADLMSLVTKYKLNNKIGNAIIRFFNKHSKQPISPLPKNIEQGLKLIDKMKIPNLLNQEHFILKYNGFDYILYYRPIINCIKNLLSQEDIKQYISYNFKNIQVIIFF